MVTQINKDTIIYPDSDGKPMADNTKQFRWIVTIKENLDLLFAQQTVFVGGDLLWYPVEGNNKIRQAPDVMVAFERPKGDRGSYMQWKEQGIAPQVVFEILSPGNTVSEMNRKQAFYNRYGVEEYYIYDPDDNDLSGWIRAESKLEIIENMDGWVSPRLGIKFVCGEPELQIFHPNGRVFKTYLEVAQELESAQQYLEKQRADIERQRADIERQRADKLAEYLKSMGIDPESIE